MTLFKSLFRDRSKDIEELRQKLFAIRYHQTLDSKRMSYLSSRHPEIYAHLVNKSEPVAKVRKSEKEKIMADIDAMLEPLK